MVCNISRWRAPTVHAHSKNECRIDRLKMTFGTSNVASEGELVVIIRFNVPMRDDYEGQGSM